MPHGDGEPRAVLREDVVAEHNVGPSITEPGQNPLAEIKGNKNHQFPPSGFYRFFIGDCMKLR
jgi:hypothetical protein